MLINIAILSDIHGNLPALEAVVVDIHKRQVDYIVNLGDHLSGPLWPKETAAYLMEHNWINICGNHDRQLTHQDPQEHNQSDRYAYQQLSRTELDWLRSLPATLHLESQFVLCHGAPTRDTTYLLETIEHGRTRLATHDEISSRLGETKSTAIFCGHTHKPRVVKLPDNTLVINPGSVGLQAYSDNSPAPHVTENGSPDARYAIFNFQEDHWRVDLVVVPYDYPQAVEQARKNNRPDWAVALQSGFAR